MTAKTIKELGSDIVIAVESLDQFELKSVLMSINVRVLISYECIYIHMYIYIYT